MLFSLRNMDKGRDVASQIEERMDLDSRLLRA